MRVRNSTTLRFLAQIEQRISWRSLSSRTATGSVKLIGLVFLGLTLFSPDSAMGARHWFTDQNRTLKTELYEAAASRNAYCDPSRRDGSLIVTLRFTSDIDFEIGNHPTYLQIVESEIASVVRDVCGEVTDLVILNFFKLPLTNNRGAEIPASRVIFRNLLVKEYPARRIWVWFDAIYSGEFPPRDSNSFGNNRLTTEKAIRAWLSRGTSQQLTTEFKQARDAEARRRKKAEEARLAVEQELEDLNKELLKIGTRAYKAQLDASTYRIGIDSFAKVCAAGNLDGCLRLDRAIAQLEANCRGTSEDGEAKPWTCGLYGYALEKAPILEFQHFYKNIPRVKPRKQIVSLYKEACDAGRSFYCKRR